MTPYHERMSARYALIPAEITARARTDVFIHAGIQSWLDSDDPVELLLTALVLLLSTQYEQLLQKLIDTA